MDCCEYAVLNGGNPPVCMTQSFSSKCVAGCTTSLAPSCNATDTLHVCAQPSDCASDTANHNCCDLNGVWMCVNDQLKMAPNVTCK